jgi:hypothetical protein
MIDRHAERIARLYAQGRITGKGLTKATTKGLLAADTAKRIRDTKPKKP